MYRQQALRHSADDVGSPGWTPYPAEHCIPCLFFLRDVSCWLAGSYFDEHVPRQTPSKDTSVTQRVDCNVYLRLTNQCDGRTSCQENNAKVAAITRRIAWFPYALIFQEAIISVVAESYLALDPTPAAAGAGAEALAGAVTSYSVRFEIQAVCVSPSLMLVTSRLPAFRGPALSPSTLLRFV